MNSEEIRLTKHAIERANERLGIKSNAKLLRCAATALKKGQTSQTVTHSWLRGILSRCDGDTKIMCLHNGLIYVFASTDECKVLVTVYAVPKQYLYHQGRKLSNPKKYFNKYHPECLVREE